MVKAIHLVIEATARLAQCTGMVPFYESRFVFALIIAQLLSPVGATQVPDVNDCRRVEPNSCGQLLPPPIVHKWRQMFDGECAVAHANTRPDNHNPDYEKDLERWEQAAPSSYRAKRQLITAERFRIDGCSCGP